MSSMKVYALKDSLTGFGTIFADKNKLNALRGLKDALASGEGTVAKHPEDFELWELGEFDTDTGIITSNTELVEKAINIVEKK